MVFVKFAAVQPCGKYCRQMRYALLYRHYLIVFILYGLFQCLICDLCIQLYNCSSFSWLTIASSTCGSASSAFFTVASQCPHIIPLISIVFSIV